MGATSARNATSRIPIVEVIVAEELDSRAAPRLDARLTEALDLEPLHLVVDLAACSVLDAAAIGVLLDVHRRSLRSGCLLTLRSPSPKLRRNLRLARVDGVLNVTPPMEPAAAVP